MEDRNIVGRIIFRRFKMPIFFTWRTLTLFHPYRRTHYLSIYPKNPQSPQSTLKKDFKLCLKILSSKNEKSLKDYTRGDIIFKRIYKSLEDFKESEKMGLFSCKRFERRDIK
jgi:hypothetical protein